MLLTVTSKVFSSSLVVALYSVAVIVAFSPASPVTVVEAELELTVELVGFTLTLALLEDHVTKFAPEGKVPVILAVRVALEPARRVVGFMERVISGSVEAAVTVTVRVAVVPPPVGVAVIVVVPAFTPVTTPVEESTRAIVESALPHLTVVVGVVDKVIVLPTSTVAVVGVMVNVGLVLVTVIVAVASSILGCVWPVSVARAVTV